MRRHIIALALSIVCAPLFAQTASYERILLPIQGGRLFGQSIETELVLRNDTAPQVGYYLGPSGCGCPPRLATLVRGLSMVDWIDSAFSPSGSNRSGVVLLVDPPGSIDLSLRLRKPDGSRGDGPPEGPEVPIARESDFRRTTHIVSVPNHLNTIIRVLSLDGAPTASVKVFNVEFGAETLLEQFSMTLLPPAFDQTFETLPGFAERDISSELASMDKQIPQGRIAFLIESPTPVWAYVVQQDAQTKMITFATQQ